jgi:hypothetical protein
MSDASQREWRFYLVYMIDFAVKVLALLIPWRMIIATCNRLIHGYLGIDDDTLWSITGMMCLIKALKSETLS